MSSASYRELLRIPSVPWMLTTSVIGRFNQGMTGLALMMLTTEHSSYAVASMVATAGAMGGFVSGPVLSRLADRRGRRRVLVITAVLYALVMGALAASPPRPLLLSALALAAGLCSPPMTAAVRAALPTLVGPERRRSAFALESTAQELVFVLGPPATAVLAALGGPPLAVASCGLLVLVGTLGYARDPNADVQEPNAGQPGKGGRVLRVAGIPRVLVTGSLLFASLGGEALGVVAMAGRQHASPEAGIVLACGSLGSLVGGLTYGALRGRTVRFRHLLLALAGGLVAVSFASGTGVLAFLVFLWGLTVAPAISCLLEALSVLAPPESVTEAFGWMNSALLVGNSLGSLLGGVLVTACNARASIVMAAGCALLAALISQPWALFGSRVAQHGETAIQVKENTQTNVPSGR